VMQLRSDVAIRFTDVASNKVDHLQHNDRLSAIKAKTLLPCAPLFRSETDFTSLFILVSLFLLERPLHNGRKLGVFRMSSYEGVN